MTARFQLIDGLRAVAAAAVAAFHFYGVSRLNGAPQLPGPLHEVVLEWATGGVCAFFVLSGFVISHVLRQEPTTGPRVLRFALARSVRLDPPYWVVVGLTLAVLEVGRVSVTAANLPTFAPGEVVANLLYLQDLLGIAPIVEVAWTLCLELQFYLVLAVLLWAADRWSPRLGRGPVELLLFGPLTVFSFAILLGWVSAPWPGLFVSHWGLFMVGVLVRDALLYPGRAATNGVTLLCILLAALLWPSPALSYTLLTALVLLLAGRRGRLVAGLAQRPVQALGRWSYSFYLLHPLVGCNLIRVLRRWVPADEPATAWLLVALATAASVGAAAFLFTLVERPSHRLSRRLKRA